MFFDTETISCLLIDGRSSLEESGEQISEDIRGLLDFTVSININNCCVEAMAGVHHPLFEDWLCLVDILLGLVSLRSETLNLKSQGLSLTYLCRRSL